MKLHMIKQKWAQWQIITIWHDVEELLYSSSET